MEADVDVVAPTAAERCGRAGCVRRTLPLRYPSTSTKGWRWDAARGFSGGCTRKPNRDLWRTAAHSESVRSGCWSASSSTVGSAGDTGGFTCRSGTGPCINNGAGTAEASVVPRDAQVSEGSASDSAGGVTASASPSALFECQCVPLFRRISSLTSMHITLTASRSGSANVLRPAILFFVCLFVCCCCSVCHTHGE